MTDITIRTSRSTDAAALQRLAILDSQRPPTGSVLVAEVDGVVVAAVTPDGRAIADPFSPTAGAVELLRLRAQREHRTAPRERHGIFAVLPRLA